MRVLLVIFSLLCAYAMPQQQNVCSDASYEDHNQGDYKPLKLATLQGRGVIEIKDNVVKPNETVPGACLSLFTLDQKFVRSVKADAAGEFKFENVAPGRYRLIARAQGFCTANIPINLVKASSMSKLRENEIIVHYRLTGIDTCSWGELGKKAENPSAGRVALDKSEGVVKSIVVLAGDGWPSIRGRVALDKSEGVVKAQ